MESLPIRRLIEQILSGSLRVPAFQRKFVWGPERVARLMDSIYKGYPFGAVILWRTKEKLTTERSLGPFPLPEPQAGFPVDYILDGQQRITSIFGVFQTDIKPNLGEEPWPEVYFDLNAPEDHQESQFFALSSDEVEAGRHFPINTFFDVVSYRQATNALASADAERVDVVQSIFKEASIPAQIIETDNRARVAIVFERVNSLGAKLDTMQLLSAWTWSEDFDLQHRINALSEELRPFGFEAVGDDTNLLLRCCAAVVDGDVSPSAVMNIKGTRLRNRFEEVEHGIRGAIDFVKSNLNVAHLSNLPYSALIVPLAVYFANPSGKSPSLSDDQRRTLLRWFWRSCFSRRFSAGVIRNLNRDIRESELLRTKGHSQLADFSAAVDMTFFGQQFSIGTTTTKTFVLLLAQAGPRGFVSGTPISLAKVLQDYNRNEFHHLFPRAHLKSLGASDRDINRLSNIAFMSSRDNKLLGGVSPSQYRPRMAQAAVSGILTGAICPESLFSDDYEAFCVARGAMLLQAARNLIQ